MRERSRRLLLRRRPTKIIVLAVAAVSGGLVCDFVNRAHQRAARVRSARAAVERLHGIVYYDYEYQSNGRRMFDAEIPWTTRLHKRTAPDYFANIAGIELPVYQPARAALNPFALQDDQVLALAPSLGTATHLTLTGASITENVLPCLREMPHLRSLVLNCPAISDTGIQEIAALKEIEVLVLAGTTISDRGIRRLTKLRTLRVLRLPSTVSDRTASQIKEALPKCSVIRG